MGRYFASTPVNTGGRVVTRYAPRFRMWYTQPPGDPDSRSWSTSDASAKRVHAEVVSEFGGARRAVRSSRAADRAPEPRKGARRARRPTTGRKPVRNWKVGARVLLDRPRVPLAGTVIKVNARSLIVAIDGDARRWRVPLGYKYLQPLRGARARNNPQDRYAPDGFALMSDADLRSVGMDPASVRAADADRIKRLRAEDARKAQAERAGQYVPVASLRKGDVVYDGYRENVVVLGRGTYLAEEGRGRVPAVIYRQSDGSLGSFELNDYDPPVILIRRAAARSRKAAQRPRSARPKPRRRAPRKTARKATRKPAKRRSRSR